MLVIGWGAGGWDELGQVAGDKIREKSTFVVGGGLNNIC